MLWLILPFFSFTHTVQKKNLLSFPVCMLSFCHISKAPPGQELNTLHGHHGGFQLKNYWSSCGLEEKLPLVDNYKNDQGTLPKMKEIVIVINLDFLLSTHSFRSVYILCFIIQLYQLILLRVVSLQECVLLTFLMACFVSAVPPLVVACWQEEVQESANTFYIV